MKCFAEKERVLCWEEYKKTMQKYDKYKPAGVDWIDKIPDSWDLKRTKWVFTESNHRNRELNFQDEDLLSVSEYYGQGDQD